jgi:short-subunit dehydrogenase
MIPTIFIATQIKSSVTETVYFITGTSRGIGLEFVKQLKRENVVIYAGARNQTSLEKAFPSPPRNLHIV